MRRSGLDVERVTYYQWALFPVLAVCVSQCAAGGCGTPRSVRRASSTAANVREPPRGPRRPLDQPPVGLVALRAGTVAGMSAAFELLLFAVEPGFVREAAAAGIDGIVVDWERQGKRERQLGVDTEINEQTVGDLVRVRATTRVPVICRVEPVQRRERRRGRGGPRPAAPTRSSCRWSGRRDEVERMLHLVDGRCGVGILVETAQAVAASAALARLPISRVYVGLNDLAIDRGSASIFDALLDGTVERVRAEFDVPFGFGGLTLPDRGAPIPCRQLIAEMVRLDCSFSFLRRSFRRDVRPK